MTEVNKTCPTGYTYLSPSGALPRGACKNSNSGDFFEFPVVDKGLGLEVESVKPDSAPPPARNAPMVIGAGGGTQPPRTLPPPVNTGNGSSCSSTVVVAGMEIPNPACQDR